MKKNLQRMKELNSKLLAASDSYYKEHNEIMSNFEYDKLFDELKALEEETGVVLDNSITKVVGNDLNVEFNKITHSKPVLSLDKTKSIEDLNKFAGENSVNISMKLDGLTVVLTYDNGVLKQAVTRGNGQIGDEITEQAKLFQNVPQKINNSGTLVVRGEALMSYSDFNKLNTNNQFKNPRNLASGTVKNKNLQVFKERPINFLAFELVECDKQFESHTKCLNYLSQLGFDIVDNQKSSPKDISKTIEQFTSKVQNNYDWPVDGLVIFIDSLKIQKQLGVSSHHPKYAKAFKWQDTCKETILRDIQWHRSRSGRLNPIAIFDPVELEGTTVVKASLHNVTYIEDMKLGIGDKVTVYKANMIIPQIEQNLTRSLKDINTILPGNCPECGAPTKIKNDNGTKFLYCDNEQCTATLCDNLILFTNILGIKHIAKQTLDKLIDAGIITKRSDIFELNKYETDFASIEGLGSGMFKRLNKEIESVKPYPHQFIAALGIPLISLENAKLLTKDRSLDELLTTEQSEFLKMNGIGPTVAKSACDYFSKHHDEILELASFLQFAEVTKQQTNDFITNKHFAVTGSLNTYKNRNELKSFIENHGGKVTGVSKTTDYLINNDSTSKSSKNQKAKELGVKIITEEEFNNLI